MNDPAKLTSKLGELINEIKDDSTREFTTAMVQEAFPVWERHASKSHHLPDEREKYGNLLHTIRVAGLCSLMNEALQIDAGDNSSGSEDILLSAAILHDLCRYGLFNLSESSRPDHPKLVRQFAIEHDLTCDNFDEIMEVIESHMGKWSESPILLTIDASTALHLADCIVARWAEVMPSGSKET